MAHSGDVFPRSQTKEADPPEGEARRLPQVQQPGLLEEAKGPGRGFFEKMECVDAYDLNVLP